MSPKRRQSIRLSLEALEAREVLSTSPTVALLDTALTYQSVALIGNGGGGVIVGGDGGVVGTTTGTVYDPSHPSESDLDFAMGLPQLDSKPGAPVTIHLDFTGHAFEGDWEGDGIVDAVRMTPFTTDVQGTPQNIKTFSADEKARILNIWSRVAEDFAPFNINVSTHYYGSFDDGKAVKVVIGEYDGAWLPEHITMFGVSKRNSFIRSDLPNLTFVFTDRGVALNSARIAQTASHEVGHTFGLAHMSAEGSTAEWSPIMGAGLPITPRITWAKGKLEDTPSKTQDDMAVLARPENVFGYRPDDHGNNHATATWLTEAPTGPMIEPPRFIGSGIIHQTTDIDAFKFTNDGGFVTVRLDLAQFEPNLIPALEIWSSSGRLVTIRQHQAKPIVFNANLGQGTFYVMVKSHGSYGEVGQYRVTATLDNGPVLSQDLALATSPVSLITSPQQSVASLAVLPVISSSSTGRTVATDGVFADMNWRLTRRGAAEIAALTLLAPSASSELGDAFAAAI